MEVGACCLFRCHFGSHHLMCSHFAYLCRWTTSSLEWVGHTFFIKNIILNPMNMRISPMVLSEEPVLFWWIIAEFDAHFVSFSFSLFSLILAVMTCRYCVTTVLENVFSQDLQALCETAHEVCLVLTRLAGFMFDSTWSMIGSHKITTASVF